MQYCEQTLAIGAFEPWNAWTNLAFVAAAIGAWWERRGAALPPSRWLLLGLACAIGAGSFAWHATHAPWAELADVLPILALVLTFLFVTARERLRWSRVGASLLCVGMLAAIVGVGVLAGTRLNGSLAYFPVWFGLAWLAMVLPAPSAQRWLKIASALFACALIARTSDLYWCQAFPRGTHWLWHLCNGGVIYLALKVAQSPSTSPATSR